MSDSLITKRAIAEALKQVCKEKPFDKISISDITAVCGLNRQTFYYHYQDKYELGFIIMKILLQLQMISVLKTGMRKSMSF